MLFSKYDEFFERYDNLFKERHILSILKDGREGFELGFVKAARLLVHISITLTSNFRACVYNMSIAVSLAGKNQVICYFVSYIRVQANKVTFYRFGFSSCV